MNGEHVLNRICSELEIIIPKLSFLSCAATAFSVGEGNGVSMDLTRDEWQGISTILMELENSLRKVDEDLASLRMKKAI